MNNRPSGTVTFLFTDIEGSTKLWEAYPDAMKVALVRHDVLMRAVIEKNRGYVFKTVGDAFCAAFPTAPDALNAALAAQRGLSAETWDMAPIRVRMALHSGNAEERDGDYFGPPLNRVARLMCGHGGQVVLSQATYELVRDRLPPQASFLDLGEHRLRDLIRPEHIYQLIAPDLRADFPPLNTVEHRASDSPAQVALQKRGVTVSDRVRYTKLIGRDESFQRLTEQLDKLKTKSGGMVLVSGEPGIGKSRLIDEIIAEARMRGYQLMLGRCHERDIAIPYIPITDALEAFARNCAPATWERLLQSAGTGIQVMLSDVLGKHLRIRDTVVRDQASAAIAAQANVRPSHAVRNLLREMSKEKPVLFVVDDLHWSDPNSLELIHDIALHVRELPVLILGAYREIELERTHPLSRLLVDLNRERLLTRERLRRFAVADTRELLSALLESEPPPGLSELIHEQTEGNPFFIEESLNGLVEDEQLIWNGKRSKYEFARGITIDILAGQIPQGIRAAIGARLDMLDPQTQQMLSLAAIIGRRFAFDLLCKLAAQHGLNEEDIEHSLEQAQSARFITPLDKPTARYENVTGFNTGIAANEDEYVFDHALIHQVVYAETDRRRRRRLHAQVGHLLEEYFRGREILYAERIAYHFVESDDDGKALEYSIIAGDKILRSYYDADMALGYYLPALEMIVAKEPGLRHLGAKAPVPIRRGTLHRFTAEEREAIVDYLGEILQAVRDLPAAKSVAQLANRICIVAMHSGPVYEASIRLYEQMLLGPNAQKLVVPTDRGKLVGILEFPDSGGPFPVVLMFHGSSGSKDSMADRAMPFRARGMATLRVDLPGFGETTVSLTQTLEDAIILKEMITAVLANDRVDKRGVGIAALSMGPWHGAQLCARDDRVRAMVSWSGMFNPLDPRPGFPSPPEVSRAFREARYKAGARPTPDPFPASPDTSVYDVAYLIRCPILLMYGSLDPERFRANAEELAALVPTAKKQEWRNGLHGLVNVPEAYESAAEWMKQQLK